MASKALTVLVAVVGLVGCSGGQQAGSSGSTGGSGSTGSGSTSGSSASSSSSGGTTASCPVGGDGTVADAGLCAANLTFPDNGPAPRVLWTWPFVDAGYPFLPEPSPVVDPAQVVPDGTYYLVENLSPVSVGGPQTFRTAVRISGNDAFVTEEWNCSPSTHQHTQLAAAPDGGFLGTGRALCGGAFTSFEGDSIEFVDGGFRLYWYGDERKTWLLVP